jgi:hypothetical protein
MSHDDAHATASAPFSPEECAALRADDVKAARSVVLLMIGVFLAGVVLYTIVAMSI